MTPVPASSSLCPGRHLSSQRHLQGHSSIVFRPCSKRPSRLRCRSQRNSNNNSNAGLQEQGFMYESLNKAVLAINRIIFDYEQRRNRAKSQAAAAGSAPPVETPQKGQLVSFRASARHEKLIKEPGLMLEDGSTSDTTPDPSRGLQAYLALPLDQYSLLDPRWITRDPGGGDLFLLRVPLQDVVGLALEPQITVRVNIDSRNSQVQFLADKFKVGDPKFDEDFRVDMKALLKRKPIAGMRSFRLPNPWRRGRRAAKTSPAALPAAVAAPTAATAATAAAASAAAAAAAAAVPIGEGSTAHGTVITSASQGQDQQNQQSGCQQAQEQQDSSLQEACEQEGRDSLATGQVVSTSSSWPSTVGGGGAGVAGNNGSNGMNGSTTNRSTSSNGSTNSSTNSSKSSAINSSRPGYISTSPFASTVQQYSQQSGRTTVQARSKASILALDAEIASTASAWRASGGASGGSSSTIRTLTTSSTAIDNAGATSSSSFAPLAEQSAVAAAASGAAASADGSRGQVVSVGTSGEGVPLDAAAAAATASGSGRSMDVPGATAFLSGSVDVGFTVMVPHPLSIVPRPLLYMTGSLIARFALQSLLPSFLDLLAVDYSRWAAGNGAARSQPAGNLVTADMAATAAAAAAAGDGVIATTNDVIDDDGSSSALAVEAQLLQVAAAGGAVQDGGESEDGEDTLDNLAGQSSGSEHEEGHSSEDGHSSGSEHDDTTRSSNGTYDSRCISDTPACGEQTSVPVGAKAISNGGASKLRAGVVPITDDYAVLTADAVSGTPLKVADPGVEISSDVMDQVVSEVQARGRFWRLQALSRRLRSFSLAR